MCWKHCELSYLSLLKIYFSTQEEKFCIFKPGLLIFRAVAELRNSRKSAKSHKIHKNTKNTAKLISTYFSYRGYLLAVNLQIYLGTWSLKHANNVPKLPGLDYVAKKWALAMMLKALSLVHFWSILLLKEQMMTSVRKRLKMLVWSSQNRSISSEICLKNNHKNPRNRPIFLQICP